MATPSGVTERIKGHMGRPCQSASKSGMDSDAILGFLWTPRCTSLQNPLVKHQLQLCPLHTSSTCLEGEGVTPQASSSQNKSQGTGAFARRCQTLQQSGTCGQGINLPAFGSGSSGLSGPMLICWDCYHITGSPLVL